MEFELSKNLITLAEIFLSFYILVQGIIVFAQNPKSDINRSFFIFQLCVFFWMSCTGFAYLFSDIDTSLVISKFGFLGISALPVTAYIFSSFLRGIKPNRILTIPGILFTVLVFLNINNPFYVSGILIYKWGNFVSLGQGSFLVILLFVIFILFTIKNLYSLYDSAERRKKWYLFVFISGVISFFGLIDFLPAYGRLTSIHPLGFIFVGIFSCYLGYFIIKYSLANMSIVFGRVIGHTIMIGLLGLIYISLFFSFFPGESDTDDILLNLLFFVSAIYLFNLLNFIGKKLVREIFYKNQIKFDDKISDFGKRLYSLQNSKIFFKEVFNFVEDEMRITDPFFLIIDQIDRSWILIKFDGTKIISEKVKFNFDDEMISNVSKDSNIIDIRHVSHSNAIMKEAVTLSEKEGGTVLLPLISRSGFIGYLAFGKQLSDQSYDFNDKNGLLALASSVGVAFGNIKLFENIERDNRQKMDFVSIASHQLRTPLTRLKWALESVSAKSDLDEDTKDLVQDLRISTENMINLVGQLLGVAQSERGEVISTTTGLVFPIVSEVVEKKMQEAIEKNIILTLNNKNIGMKAKFSEKSLRIIVETLIDNAIQYTPKGGKVDVSLDESANNILEIKILDNGIGIPEEEQGDVFNKFFRGSSAISVRPDGTGLGLYYAKLLAEKQGGNVWFSSKKEGGTLFHISLAK